MKIEHREMREHVKSWVRAKKREGEGVKERKRSTLITLGVSHFFSLQEVSNDMIIYDCWIIENTASDCMESLFSNLAIISDYMETLFSNQAIMSNPTLE